MTRDTPFGSLVRHRRVELGISQAGLADLVGRSASAVRSWERGSSTPTDETVVGSLAAILGLDEGALRTAVGMPADVIAEEAEEIGGKGLVAFSDEAAEDDAAAESAGEISWDDVAETVRGEAKNRSAEEPSEAEAPWVDDSHDEHTADETQAAKPEDSPGGDGIGTGVADDEPGVPAQEPDRTVPEPDVIPVLPTSRARPETTGPVPTDTTASSRTTVMPRSAPAAPPVPDSYLDDQDQMMTYWIRAALTVALTMFLVIVLFWALGNLSDSIGEVWDLFKAAS